MTKSIKDNQSIFLRIVYFLLVLSLLSIGACRSAKKKAASKKEEKHLSSRKERKEERKKAKKNKTHNKKEADKVISTARTFIGTPYRYGGTTRAGLDCSGLMVLSFNSVEIKLPRTSEEQSKIGKPVSNGDWLPGDLVFFTDKKGHRKVTHVGLVTEVRDKETVKFIHSSTKLGVVENNLKSDVYYPIYLKAVRLF